MGTLATALACLALGCPGSPPPEVPPKPFALFYEKSGGLKPMPQKLTIAPGRRAVATIAGTRAGNRTVRFRISEERVASLKAGLRRARFSTLESTFPGSCADCFRYELRYRGHEVTVDESTMPAGLGEVVSDLESLIYAHAIPPTFELGLIALSTRDRVSRRRR